MPDSIIADAERERLAGVDVLIDEWIARMLADLDRAKSEPREFDPAFAERFRETARRLSKRLNEELPPELGAEAVAEIRGIIVDALHALDDIDDEHPWDAVEAFVLKAEAIRHIVRDALDAHIESDGRDAKALVGALQEWLPRVTQVEQARLLNISPRQLQRWKRDGGTPNRRLVLVAQLVALLRRAWTPEGIVAWFYRPRRELHDLPPIDALDDPAFEAELLTAVRQGRAQHGS
jgi:hypothetical protein